MTPTNPIGVEVLKALGLPSSRAVSLTLKFKACEVVEAEAIYLPEAAQIDEVVTLLRKWRAGAVEG